MTDSSAPYYLAPLEPAPEAASLQEELLRLAVALNEGATTAQIVDVLFETIDHLIPFHRVAFAQLVAEGVLELVHIRSRGEILWGVGARAPLAGSSLAPVFRDRQVRVIPDLEVYAREHPDSPSAPILVAEGVRSSLAVPVTSKGKAIGVLFLGSRSRDAFRPEHVDFLRACAAIIGAAFERVSLSDELRNAYQELKALESLKAQFLDNLSHELRTPLTKILTYAFALEDLVLGEGARESRAYVREVISAAERLKELVAELLDFSALQAGLLEIGKVQVDLGGIARELSGVMRQVFDTAGLELRLELPGEAITASADPIRIAQALRALLDNARKFTPRGGTVTVRAGQDAREVWLEVADTGIGIPQEQQDKILRPFHQVEGGLSRRFGGTGLGLAMARALAQAHGGDVTFRRAEGPGSTFRLALPRHNLAAG